MNIPGGDGLYTQIVEGIADRGRAAQETRGMYVDEQGVTRCAVCHKPLRCFVQGLGEMPTPCDCDEREDAERRQREAAEEARRRVQDSALYDRNTNGVKFSDDAAPDSEAGKICRAYVEQFEQMRRDAFGLMFTGTMGTGKSFYAAAIGNELIARGIPALMFTSSRLVSTGAKSIQSLIDEANSFPLVVLDDLGAERSTDYAVEIVEAFVNARYTARKPLIVTTNLTTKQMTSPSDMRYARIFDRLRVMCPRVIVLTGESRRVEQQRERAAQMRDALGV